MKHFDIAIVGAGPAGASAAETLSKKGFSTVIIEKETLPRYKTCGGGFTFRGRKMLPFDIDHVVEKEFYKVDTYINNKHHFVTERDKPIITMVMRDTFDELLVEHAKKSGTILWDNCKLTGLEPTTANKTIVKTTKEDFTAAYIIAADGALSPTAKLAGWSKDSRYLIPALEYEVKVPDEDFERLSQSVRFDIDAIPAGYAWCFPKKNHLSLGIASARRKKINLKKYYKEYLNTLNISSILEEKQFGFQIPVQPREDGFAKQNVLLVGDAAGLADPITAEGISNSILSGKLAAEAIIEGNVNHNVGNLYEIKLNEKLIPEIKTGIFIAKFFYDNPKLRNLLIPKYGIKGVEALTDLYMGDRNYPKDISKKITQKIKEAIM